MTEERVAFKLPVEILEKAKLADSLFLNKIFFTRDMKTSREGFNESSTFKGLFEDIYVYETHIGQELFGVTLVPQTEQVTRYNNYKFQFTQDSSIFNYTSDSKRTILYLKTNELILFTNHNDSQTMVIVSRKENNNE